MAVTRELWPLTWAADSRSSTTSATSSRVRRRSATDGLMPRPAPAGSRIRSERLPPLTAAETDSFSEVAVTATAATTVRPMVSARAVAAERRELRAMLRAAIRHPPPRRPWSASRAIPRARVGPATTSPAKVVTVANTVAHRWLPTTAQATSIARPAPVTIHPAVRRVRRRRRWPGRRCAGPPWVPRGWRTMRVRWRRPSSRAARRPARPGWSASPGRVRCSGSRRRSASSSTRMRGGEPDAEQHADGAGDQPIIPASMRTPASTCRRVAPTARSSATSRRRWATSTLKVFQMTKEPTTTETPAKTSSTVVKMPSESRTASVPSAATCSPVRASTPSGSTRGDAVAQLAGAHAVGGHDVDLVDDSRLAERLLGRGQVEPGEGGAQQAVGLPEADDRDQGEGPPAVLEHDVDRVAELVAGLLRGARVECHLVRRRTACGPRGSWRRRRAGGLR